MYLVHFLLVAWWLVSVLAAPTEGTESKSVNIGPRTASVKDFDFHGLSYAQEADLKTVYKDLYKEVMNNLRRAFPRGPPDYVIDQAKRTLRERFQAETDSLRERIEAKKYEAERRIRSKIDRLQKQLDKELRKKEAGSSSHNGSPKIVREIANLRKQLEIEVKNRLQGSKEAQRVPVARKTKHEGGNGAKGITSADDASSGSSRASAETSAFAPARGDDVFGQRIESHSQNIGFGPNMSMRRPRAGVIAGGIGVGFAGLLNGLKTVSWMGSY